MDIVNYVIKRILHMIPVFLAVTVLIFVLIRMIPGDPALAMLGERATQELLEAKRVVMGLDRSYPEQFWIYFKDLLHLDFGNSVRYKVPVTSLLFDRLGTTVALTISSTIFAVLLGFIPGYIAGMHKDQPVDQAIRAFALLGLSIPPFWIGLVLLTIFAVNLGWVPVAGWGTTSLDHIKCLILPGITQAFAVCAVLTRNLRNNVVDIRKSDYVDFARSKGIPESLLSRNHIIRNALIPAVTLLSLRISVMLGGSVVIETVFTLPGVGALLTNAIYARDYAVVQGCVLIMIFLVMAVNLTTDIVYSLLDPRVKL